MADYNSIQNQQIKGQFVDKHIYAGVTSLVEFVLKTGSEQAVAPFTLDELDNDIHFEDQNGNCYSESERHYQLVAWEEELDQLNDQLADAPDSPGLLSSIEKLETDISILQDADERYLEIYEWWIVSRYLGEKLKKHGQPVLEDGQNYYWGRCTTGQAILLDAVIGRICEEMLILDGQKHSWAT